MMQQALAFIFFMAHDMHELCLQGRSTSDLEQKSKHSSQVANLYEEEENSAILAVVFAPASGNESKMMFSPSKNRFQQPLLSLPWLRSCLYFR